MLVFTHVRLLALGPLGLENARSARSIITQIQLLVARYSLLGLGKIRSLVFGYENGKCTTTITTYLLDKFDFWRSATSVVYSLRLLNFNVFNSTK